MMASRTASVCVEEALQPAAALDNQPAQRPLSLRCNFSWMFVANVVYAGCQWGMLSLLTKLGTLAMVGQFVLALAITTPVMSLLMLQLRMVQATDAKGEYRFGDYLALRLATIPLALAVITGISLAFEYRRETALVIIAVAVSAAVHSISDVIYGLLQRHQRMDRVAQSMMVKGALSLLALAVTMLVTGRVFYGVLAMAAARVVILVGWDFPNAGRVLGGSLRPWRGNGAYRRLLPRWDARTMLALSRLSFPLGLVMLLVALKNNVPRYAVEHFWGEDSLGIYGPLAYFTLVGTTAIRAIGASATPRLAQCYAEGRASSFGMLALKLAAIAGAIGAGGVIVAMFAGPAILTILYQPEYAKYNNVLVWTMVAGAINYVASIGHCAINAARYFRAQLPLFAVVAGTAAVACAWLVPRYGLLGAALSFCLAALAQLVGSGIVVSHALGALRRAPSIAAGVAEAP